MLIRNDNQFPMPAYPIENDYDLKQIAFFDIETTGFAADTTYLYLIGCAYYSEGSFHLIQWFSEGIQEEALLITSFFEFIKNHRVLFHYNGNGFDIPYLQRKIAKLNLSYSFDPFESVDIYRKILPYKKIFKIDSLKLKSLETFLNIHRHDPFSGGDLIQIYQGYLGKKHYETLKAFRNPELQLPSPSEAELLLGQLLLHNSEDIQGLLSISSILSYIDLFEKPIHIIKAVIENGLLRIRFEISASLPTPIHCRNEFAQLAAHKEEAVLSVEIYEGVLKYYFDNYRDYYYLPLEDCAIHKSVAHFVDKDHRVKAKPSTCYTKKQAIFVPQYEPLITPNFKLEFTDKISFLEVHTDFLLQETNLELYVKHMMAHML